MTKKIMLFEYFGLFVAEVSQEQMKSNYIKNNKNIDLGFKPRISNLFLDLFPFIVYVYLFLFPSKSSFITIL